MLKMIDRFNDAIAFAINTVVCSKVANYSWE